MAATVSPPWGYEATVLRGGKFRSLLSPQLVARDRASESSSQGRVPMRCLPTGMLMLAAAGCTARDAETRKEEPTAVPTAVAFDGADYENECGEDRPWQAARNAIRLQRLPRRGLLWS